MVSAFAYFWFINRVTQDTRHALGLGFGAKIMNNLGQAGVMVDRVLASVTH